MMMHRKDWISSWTFMMFVMMIAQDGTSVFCDEVTTVPVPEQEWFAAVQNKELETVKTLYRQASPETRKTWGVFKEQESGKSILHVAVEENFSAFIKAIFDSDDKDSIFDVQDFDLSLKDHAGRTAMLTACMLAREDIVRSFLHAENSMTWKDRNPLNGWYPIHYATNGTSDDHFVVLEHLLFELNNDEDSPGESLEENEEETSSKFLSLPHEVQVNFTTEDTGDSPLHIAARLNLIDVVQSLSSFQVNANLQNKDGDTPLHVAAKYAEEMDMITELLHVGGNMNLTNHEGLTPRDVATKNLKISEHIDEFVSEFMEQSYREEDDWDMEDNSEYEEEWEAEHEQFDIHDSRSDMGNDEEFSDEEFNDAESNDEEFIHEEF